MSAIHPTVLSAFVTALGRPIDAAIGTAQQQAIHAANDSTIAAAQQHAVKTAFSAAERPAQ